MTLIAVESQLRPLTAPLLGEKSRKSKSTGASRRPTSTGGVPDQNPARPSKSFRKFGPVLSQSALKYLDGEIGEDEYEEEEEGKGDEIAPLRKAEEVTQRATFYVERLPRNRPKSFVDKKIEQVQQNRMTLIREKEAAIKKRVEDRVEKKKQMVELQRMRGLQTSWMTLISTFSRFNIMVNAVLYERKELLRWKNASRDEKSVRDIEIWWPRQYIIFKLYKKFPWSRFALASLFMNRWRKLRIAQRYASQNLIVRFIKDVTGLGETMRKIYQFRMKVKRCQDWVYMYYKLNFARLQVLWKALQREEERLKKVVAQGMKIKNKRNSMFVSSIKGFGDKVGMIDQVSSNISTLLKFQEGLDTRRQHKDNMTRSKQSMRVANRIIPLMLTWKSEMEATENGVEKMAFLIQLLNELRRANVVKNDAMKHRTSGKGPRADEYDAKIFLENKNKNPMPKLAETLLELEDPSVKRSKRSPFYMLTGNGGAIDAIREWTERFMRAKYFEEFELVEDEARNPTLYPEKKFKMNLL